MFGFKVVLTKCNIVRVHCKAVLLYKILKPREVKAIYDKYRIDDEVDE